MRKLKNILFLFSMLFVILLASACSMKKGNPTKSYELLINDSKVVITYTYTEKEEKVLKEKVINIKEGNITPDSSKCIKENCEYFKVCRYAKLIVENGNASEVEDE